MGYTRAPLHPVRSLHRALREARDVTYSGRLAIRADFDLSPSDSSLQIMLSPFAGYTLGPDLFESTSDPKNEYTVSSMRAGIEIKLGIAVAG